MHIKKTREEVRMFEVRRQCASFPKVVRVTTQLTRGPLPLYRLSIFYDIEVKSRHKNVID